MNAIHLADSRGFSVRAISRLRFYRRFDTVACVGVEQRARARPRLEVKARWVEARQNRNVRRDNIVITPHWNRLPHVAIGAAAQPLLSICCDSTTQCPIRITGFKSRRPDQKFSNTHSRNVCSPARFGVHLESKMDAKRPTRRARTRKPILRFGGNWLLARGEFPTRYSKSSQYSKLCDVELAPLSHSWNHGRYHIPSWSNLALQCWQRTVRDSGGLPGTGATQV
jgi:hypothetical protein